MKDDNIVRCATLHAETDGILVAFLGIGMQTEPFVRQTTRHRPLRSQALSRIRIPRSRSQEVHGQSGEDRKWRGNGSGDREGARDVFLYPVSLLNVIPHSSEIYLPGGTSG